MTQVLHCQVVVVSGLAGAGKSTALHALEDLGFFCVDNLPLPLLDRFVDLCARGELQRIAVVADAREGEFLREFAETLRHLRSAGHETRVCFLDARDEVLIRRFSETRRRHPMGGASLAESIGKERTLLRKVREEADVVLDTTTLSPNDLKRAVLDALGQTAERLPVSLVSFGYKYGLPAEADLVLDVRLLHNPYFVDELRSLDGCDPRVQAYVLKTPEATELLRHTESMLEFLLSRYEREGKGLFTVAIGCTGGKHRSVVVAEELARRFGERFHLRVRHRDLGRE